MFSGRNFVLESCSCVRDTSRDRLLSDCKDKEKEEEEEEDRRWNQERRENAELLGFTVLGLQMR
jgi:hypothetical protein